MVSPATANRIYPMPAKEQAARTCSGLEGHFSGITDVTEKRRFESWREII